MRFIFESNYVLDVRELLNEVEPDVARFLTGGWLLTINNGPSVTFVSYLPASPWPPPPAVDLDVAHDHDEAARVVFTTSHQLVAPTLGEERIDELVDDISQKHTVFWVTEKRYAELDAELRALLERPYIHPKRLQLSDLGNGALRAFLKDDLPRSAALAEYERKILCL